MDVKKVKDIKRRKNIGISIVVWMLLSILLSLPAFLGASAGQAGLGITPDQISIVVSGMVIALFPTVTFIKKFLSSSDNKTS